jgi:hypothetical protein
MRTPNFAITIRRVFANAAAIVTGKRSSHKRRWHARHYDSWQGVMRFIMRLVAVVRRDRSLAPLCTSRGLQLCSVATQRICVGPVERS